MSEKNIVTIGDDVTLNAGCFIQCHSQEDYAFKSDATTIGSGSTIGIGATVHYGVTMGDGAVLAPESFLMKGEEIPPGERWGGNPAQEVPDTWVHPARLRALESGGTGSVGTGSNGSNGTNGTDSEPDTPLDELPSADPAAHGWRVMAMRQLDPAARGWRVITRRQWAGDVAVLDGGEQ